MTAPDDGVDPTAPEQAAGVPVKPRRPDQTVCDEPGTKDKFCAGHLKLFALAPKELRARVPKGHVLFRCHRCGQIYEGEPLLHLH